MPYKDINLDEIRAKIEELKLRRATQPTFGRRKAKQALEPKMSKEEKAKLWKEFKEIKKKEKLEAIDLESAASNDQPMPSTDKSE